MVIDKLAQGVGLLMRPTGATTAEAKVAKVEGPEGSVTVVLGPNPDGSWPTKHRKLPSKPRRRITKHIATYTAWRNMLARCYNPKHVSYPLYGGRGIRVFKEWTKRYPEGFKAFVRDIGLRPSPRVTLDRKEVDGHYVPSNVRWATKEVQANNKRGTKLVEHPTTGLLVKPADLARELGIDYRKLRWMLMKAGKWKVNSSYDELRKNMHGSMANMQKKFDELKEKGYGKPFPPKGDATDDTDAKDQE